jgi:hypothetical protein
LAGFEILPIRLPRNWAKAGAWSPDVYEKRMNFRAFLSK